jgi:hypothetical protein
VETADCSSTLGVNQSCHLLNVSRRCYGDHLRVRSSSFLARNGRLEFVSSHQASGHRRGGGCKPVCPWGYFSRGVNYQEAKAKVIEGDNVKVESLKIL